MRGRQEFLIEDGGVSSYFSVTGVSDRIIQGEVSAFIPAMLYVVLDQSARLRLYGFTNKWKLLIGFSRLFFASGRL